MEQLETGLSFEEEKGEVQKSLALLEYAIQTNDFESLIQFMDAIKKEAKTNKNYEAALQDKIYEIKISGTKQDKAIAILFSQSFAEIQKSFPEFLENYSDLAGVSGSIARLGFISEGNNELKTTIAIGEFIMGERFKTQDLFGAADENIPVILFNTALAYEKIENYNKAVEFLIAAIHGFCEAGLRAKIEEQLEKIRQIPTISLELCQKINCLIIRTNHPISNAQNKKVAA